MGAMGQNNKMRRLAGCIAYQRSKSTMDEVRSRVQVEVGKRSRECSMQNRTQCRPGLALVIQFSALG